MADKQKPSIQITANGAFFNGLRVPMPQAGIIPVAESSQFAMPLSQVASTGWAYMDGRQFNMSYIDLRQDRATGVSALNEASANALLSARDNPRMQELLANPEWNRVDREEYEAIVSHSVAQAFDSQPLLRDYRREGNHPDGTSIRGNRTRDMTHLTEAHELDCDGLSALKGIAQHRIEQTLLGGERHQGLKQAQEYYMIPGRVEFGQRQPGSHAAIMSSATGNLIEATLSDDPYIVSTYDYEFKDYVAGLPFVGERVSSSTGEVIPQGRVRMGTATPDLLTINRRQNAAESGDIGTLMNSQIPVIPHERARDHLNRGEQLLQLRESMQEVPVELARGLNNEDQTVNSWSAAPRQQGSRNTRTER